MKINVRGILEGKNEIHFEEEAADFGFPDTAIIEGSILLDGIMEKRNRQFILAAEIQCGLKAECSRCLQPVHRSMRVPLKVYFQIGGDRQGDETDREIIYVAETEQYIDLTETVREAVLLDIPVKLLCDQECKGLCPQCGADLNSETCGCSDRKIDSRWAALESLGK